MAKSDSVATSFRLRDEARFILEQRAEDWGISKTAVIEKLLLATESPSEVSSPSPIPSTLARVPDPASIPGVSVGVPRTTGQFPCRCAHSGCRGATFQGASKLANLCPACSESGHRGDPRSCQECFNDMGPA